MSVIMMGTTIAAIGLRVHNVVALSKFVPADVAAGSDPFGKHFAQLQGTAARVRVERSLMALLSFCVWLRVFKYTRRVPVFGTIGRTMTRAFPAVRPHLHFHFHFHFHFHARAHACMSVQSLRGFQVHRFLTCFWVSA